VTVRISPLATIGPELLHRAEAAAGGPIRPDANVYRTLATYPKLMSAWLSWGGHVVRGTSLSPVLRELVVLRTALLARGRYPLAQHVRLAQEVGVDEDSLARIPKNPTAAQWDERTRAALSAVDQLHHHGRLDNRQWTDLAGHLGPTRTFDLVATVAFFRMACWMLNTCRTPLDDGQSAAKLSAPARHRGFGKETPSSTRVEPLPLERWTRELLDDTATWPRFQGKPDLRRSGVYSTLAKHPKLFRAIGPMMAHLLVDNALTDPQREIVIVRSCLHDRGAYPYRQHVGIAAGAGVTTSTLDQLTLEHPTIDDPADRAIVAALDELHRYDVITEDAWSLLAEHLEARATMDMIVTAGFYGLISFLLNTTCTRLEPGEVHLPTRPFDK
jgi:AhpD family alkylhydroperoxidase